MPPTRVRLWYFFHSGSNMHWAFGVYLCWDKAKLFSIKKDYPIKNISTNNVRFQYIWACYGLPVTFPMKKRKNNVSWEAEGRYHYSTMFHWEPEGCYLCTKFIMIAPFWLVLNGTSVNRANALLVLSWRYTLRLQMQIIHWQLAALQAKTQVVKHFFLLEWCGKGKWSLPHFWQVKNHKCNNCRTNKLMYPVSNSKYLQVKQGSVLLSAALQQKWRDSGSSYFCSNYLIIDNNW